MKCPNCDLENPATTQRCNCGYDFISRKIEKSYSDEALRVSVEASLRYKTFWPRLGAAFLDGAALAPFVWFDQVLWNFTSSAIILFLWTLIYQFYQSLSIAYSVGFLYLFGQTPGKMAMGVLVLDNKDRKLTLRQAILRNIVSVILAPIYLLLVFSNLLVGQLANRGLGDPRFLMWFFGGMVVWEVLEFITMLFNSKRRAIHDFIAGTVVVRQPIEERIVSYRKIRWALIFLLVLNLIIPRVLPERNMQLEIGQTTPGKPSRPDLETMSQFRQVMERLKEDDYRGVIKLVDEYFQGHSVTADNFILLNFKALAHSRLNEVDGAIASYERTLPIIRKMNNVEERQYASIFFSLGDQYFKKGKKDKGIASLEEGLTLEPQNSFYQIVLGEYYNESGQKTRAISHYRELLDSTSLLEEEGIVLRRKLKRLGEKVNEPFLFQSEDLSLQPFYKGFVIRLLPINEFDPAIPLKDLCLLLESKFLIPCQVLDPVKFDEKVILDPNRNQYDGEKILDLLDQIHPFPKNKQYVLVAVTGKDIYGKNTSFVYSWQNWSKGIGVLSSNRIAASIGAVYEPEVVLPRRVGIQFISTVARVLGFEKATKPNCPTSYPNELSEFLQKSSKLCESDIRQRDEFLKHYGGAPGRFDAARVREIQHVYAAYYFR
ncbi:MAG: RDD family protein [Nitrospirae bacterium]|nr:RDD family protein [Nitrospirota bacterium]